MSFSSEFHASSQFEHFFKSVSRVAFQENETFEMRFVFVAHFTNAANTALILNLIDKTALGAQYLLLLNFWKDLCVRSSRNEK